MFRDNPLWYIERCPSSSTSAFSSTKPCSRHWLLSWRERHLTSPSGAVSSVGRLDFPSWVISSCQVDSPLFLRAFTNGEPPRTVTRVFAGTDAVRRNEDVGASRPV